jgi:SpoVK/Ycf46/Vps4 family AAA+-type ATPase
MKRRKTRRKSNLDKAQYVEDKLQDKFSLWILRVIFKLNGHKEFIDNRNYFNQEYIASFLGLEKYISLIDDDKYCTKNILDILKITYLQYESQEEFTTNKVLKRNIKQLSKLIDLNKHEKKILEFTILLHQYEILDDAVGFLGRNLNTTQVYKTLSIILDIPLQKVRDAFSSESIFSKSSILTIDKRNTNDLKRKLDPISDNFFDNMLNSSEDITTMLKDTLNSCDTKYNSLKLKDYNHIQKDIDIVVPYLKDAIGLKKTGVNILLYGVPGTGKTQLSKTLAKYLKTDLYEVSYTDTDDESIDGTKRLKSYKTAQAILSNKKALLMYDEAEDIFQHGGSRQKDKAWINKMLETNIVPTIWITNNIYSIDDAIVRRFDLSIELPIPSKNKREKIVEKYSNNILQKDTISIIASCENIAPALVSSASKVVNVLDTKKQDEIFTHIINNTLKAQGYKGIQKDSNQSLPNNYNPNFINCDTSLKELAIGIKQHQNARLCLYGAAGTGKSAFGKYIADTLGKKVILKKVSDLQSKWVGECEKNIAAAFEEAKDEKAVLIFDEVDSFLSSREDATASWQVSQVNEMLVQMENFDGIFIATTNLMDNLDKASLRRFDLKLKFDYLSKIQAWNMFVSYCKELKISKLQDELKTTVENLNYLTPGDFAAVVRQSRFRPIKDTCDFINRLEDEIKVKNITNSKKMGFVV